MKDAETNVDRKCACGSVLLLQSHGHLLSLQSPLVNEVSVCRRRRPRDPVSLATLVCGCLAWPPPDEPENAESVSREWD